MTNAERLKKLEQAEDLIREVEFSYPIGNETRKLIYTVVVNTFSFIGLISGIKDDLRKAIKEETRAKDVQE